MDDAKVTVVMPVEMREELEQLAARNERTLSGEVRLALAEHFDSDRQADEGYVVRGAR